MTIIKLNKNQIDLLKCNYGVKNNYKCTSNCVREYIHNKLSDNIYFIKLNINNITMNGDNVPHKLKEFNLCFKDKKYTITEGGNIYFYIIQTFDIIFKNDINKIDLKKYKYATIFGKGPTFKDVEKIENELRCCINQASNIVNGVDFICMNDHHNLFKINEDVYKSVKYILVPQYLHINQRSCNEGYFVNILEYLNNKFFGKLIVYNLKTSKFNSNYIIDLDTAQSSANNCFEFIAKFMKVKKVDLYGIGIYKKNIKYHPNFVGNGIYDIKSIENIKKNFNQSSNKYNLEYYLN